ncbi:BON domain-containing protein [Paracoccus sp. IB05]|uniref:BON domain-containing protein n=1 Tax=Paracoccus sp. IB05 TaxID=2779367 RepID=UPI0018E8B68D|nr:BON domain-containing protein [Paracoccus sp. IB05]MBJ2149813.1 BON domain-containing protein [Paracoccus sp. IB05]
MTGDWKDRDQATEERRSVAFYGAERRPSRREWDPGNYGGLDHERGPGSGLSSPKADLPPRAACGFTGLGPKGYSRSETRVLEDVCEGLTEDDALDAAGISVTVSQGEITLAGTVPSRQAKRLAEDIAERCRGVNYVQNNLRVQAGAGS